MKKPVVSFLSGLLFLLGLIVASVVNQFQFTVKPLFDNMRYVPYMLNQDDLGQLRVLESNVYGMVSALDAYPDGTRFYFAPCFRDSNNSGLWWWYLHLLARYLVYPKKIFCFDQALYGDDKETYHKKFIGKAGYFSELQWIAGRNIGFVILYRNNRISIIPVSSKIEL